MQWHNVTNDQDIEYLQESYGGFHDSGIVNMAYIGNCIISEKLSAGTQPSILQVTFQRQYRNPFSIVLEFTDVKKLVVDSPDNYFPIIYDVALIIQDGLIYWASNGNWTVKRMDEFSKCSWIASKSLRWKIVE